MHSFPKNLPRVCVALGFRTAAELSKAAEHECKDGSTLLEFRLDYLSDPGAGVELIGKFREKHPEVFVLATCRHRQALGKFAGSYEKQIEILKRAGEQGAALADLEIEVAEQVKAGAEELRKRAALLISYHNFESTPALEPVLRRLRKIPAEGYKIATTARKPTDNLRVAELLRANEKTTLVALAMSEAGVASRILLPSLGSRFTYATPDGGVGTAAGQMPAKMLRSLYRVEKLTKQTRVYGVIADPVSHSKSPFLHNRGFQARRVDAVYLPFLVSSEQLGDWMKFAEQLPVCGFSVTIPHKQRILRYLDVIDPLARRIGAVNTVWRKAGKWRGANTDTEGVLKPLERHVRLRNAAVLIAGYGGAARAAAVALNDAGAQVTITGRNLGQAQALAKVVKGEALTVRQASAKQFDALVHATPVGMTPHTAECFFSENVPAEVVLDMVYNPHETLLLKRAKAQGCTVIAGAEMLFEQAISQFELWTGEKAPREVMRSALEAQL